MEYIYGDKKYLPSFHEALDSVARERNGIEMIEAPPFPDVAKFQSRLIDNNMPVFYALSHHKVVGWIDMNGSSNPRLAHTAGLGMGIMKSFRGQGVGSALMGLGLDHAKRKGFEKVELTVYADNLAAIALYKKFGFYQSGLCKNFRKLDGRYWDALTMERFL